MSNMHANNRVVGKSPLWTVFNIRDTKLVKSLIFLLRLNTTHQDFLS